MSRALDGPACLVNWMNVCRSARARQGDPNHTVARDNLCQLFLGPVLGAFGSHREDHEAAFLVGVLYPHLHLWWKNQTELGEDLTWPTNQSAPVVSGAVPFGRHAEQGARVARAKRADDDMMQGRRIFEDTQVHVIAGGAEAGGLCPIDPDLLTGVDRILHQPRFERRVGPSLGYQARAGGRSDRFGPLGKPAMIFSGKQAVFDCEFAYRDLEHLEVGDFFHHRRRGMLATASRLV